ncbi:hypothetical protein PsYK624_114490 [Phanerochaete sordida]|uniref:Uncharacterized protein n=1 Tax=Phanerochaete sordida TaxID=48140 RepID=A0A9P3GI95_9APHY|nr:hypothetical protein PsYK624_114490 [Phanerochaete sordida]
MVRSRSARLCVTAPGQFLYVLERSAPSYLSAIGVSDLGTMKSNVHTCLIGSDARRRCERRRRAAQTLMCLVPRLESKLSSHRAPPPRPLKTMRASRTQGSLCRSKLPPAQSTDAARHSAQCSGAQCPRLGYNGVRTPVSLSTGVCTDWERGRRAPSDPFLGPKNFCAGADGSRLRTQPRLRITRLEGCVARTKITPTLRLVPAAETNGMALADRWQT